MAHKIRTLNSSQDHDHSNGTKLHLNSDSSLKQEVINPLPSRVRSDLRPGGIDTIPIDLSPSSVNINLRCSEPSGTLPQVATGPEEENNWKSQVGLEEIFSCADFAFVAKWVERRVELDPVSLLLRKEWGTYLSHEYEKDQNKPTPRAVYATDSLEGNLIDGMAMIFPRRTEADVCQAD